LIEEKNEINEEKKEQIEDSNEVVESDEKKKVKKVKPKKLNKKKDNKFPREDRNEAITREGINPRQFSEAWTSCSRCRDQILSFGESTHFINGYQYCEECYEYVKDDYLEQESITE
tara:strand:+ start:1361 stop:1708 length:348 start_codon:yes stop_codon:yes gene_type:complete